MRSISKVFSSIIILLLLFSFSKEIVKAMPEPQQVRAKSDVLFMLEDSGGAVYYLDFYNVGALDTSGDYGEVIVNLKCAPGNNAEGCSEDLPSTTGTFSGGPNGEFKINDVEFSLIDGKETTAYDAGETVVFTVDNPEAFEGVWENEERQREAEITTDGGSDLGGGIVRGEAQLSRDKGGTYLDLGGKDPVVTIKHYDVIRTGPNSRFIIRYPDGSYFRVKSNSKVTILPNGIQLEYGDSWFNIQKQGKTFKVVTPTIVVGVLGTTYSVSHSRDLNESMVMLMEGEVEVVLPDDETLVMNPGEQLTVSETDYSQEDFDPESVLSQEQEEIVEDLAMINLDTAVDLDDTESQPQPVEEVESIQVKDETSTPDTNDITMILVAVGLGALVIVGIVAIFRKRKGE